MKKMMWVGLLALACVGCGNCLATCISAVTFKLRTPLSGSDFEITIGMSQTADGLHCQAGDASLSCTPPASRVQPTFDGSGMLASLSLGDPTPGQYRVQIAVDGTPTIDSLFQYDGTTSWKVRGSTCYGQTFTIDN